MLSVGKLPISQVNREQLDSYMAQERAKMGDLLQKFLNPCLASKVLTLRTLYQHTFFREQCTMISLPGVIKSRTWWHGKSIVKMFARSILHTKIVLIAQWIHLYNFSLSFSFYAIVGFNFFPPYNQRMKKKTLIVMWQYWFKQVEVDTVLIESDMVARAIIDLIPVLNIRKLVVGTSKSSLR